MFQERGVLLQRVHFCLPNGFKPHFQSTIQGKRGDLTEKKNDLQAIVFTRKKTFYIAQGGQQVQSPQRAIAQIVQIENFIKLTAFLSHRAGADRDFLQKIEVQAIVVADRGKIRIDRSDRGGIGAELLQIATNVRSDDREGKHSGLKLTETGGKLKFEIRITHFKDLFAPLFFTSDGEDQYQ